MCTKILTKQKFTDNTFSRKDEGVGEKGHNLKQFYGDLKAAQSF